MLRGDVPVGDAESGGGDGRSIRVPLPLLGMTNRCDGGWHATAAAAANPAIPLLGVVNDVLRRLGEKGAAW